MMQRVDFLKKRIDDTLFVLRIYEMHREKMPADNLMAEMCRKYRERILFLSDDYISFCGGTEKLTEERAYDDGI